MFKFFNFKLFRSGVTLLALLFIVQFASAQNDPQEINDGFDYWFAIPNCKTAVGEMVRWSDSPIMVWVASKYTSSFTISSEDGVTVPSATYDVAPGVIKEINLNAEVMLNDNDEERPTWKGIHIVSTEPVSVGVIIAYKWTGEAYRVIPSEWLDNEYYTVNLWQDKVKMYGGSEPELKPGEIVIVASSEGTTNIEYTPKVATPKAASGATKQISLRRGQTYLIQAKTSDAISWNTERSDLTGTHIKGDKPFAVLSGHTKGAFPQYPSTMYNIKTDFIRNMLMEMIWPTSHLAKEYISAPLKYNDRPYGNAVTNERGDLIRFVAVENNTVVREAIFNDTTNEMQYVAVSSIMNAGEFFDIPNRETPGYFIANKKVMVAQFGKSWIDHLPPPKVGNDDNGKLGDGEIQNPSKNGQGMMLVLTPFEKWCSYATFKLISGMIGNFVYFTFRSADQEKLFFDEQKFSTRFGNAIYTIPGTPYAYVVQQVAPGDHTVYGTGGAQFAGYCYGNYDACKDGFAYGYPVGMNFAAICADTLITHDTTICDSIIGNCELLYKGTGDSSCLGFWKVSMKDQESNNFAYHELTPVTDSLREFKFHLKVLDNTIPATAKIVFHTKSGRKLEKEYHYTPMVMNLNRNIMDFGSLEPGDNDSCRTLTIQNNNSIPLTLFGLARLGIGQTFSISTDDVTFPLTLNPGENVQVTVCATVLQSSLQTQLDTIWISTDCNPVKVYLSVTNAVSYLKLTEADFGQIDEGQRMEKKIAIKNDYLVDLMLDEFHHSSLPNGAFIPDTAGLFPTLLKSGDSILINVEFRPPHIGSFRDSAWVSCAVAGKNIYSIWTGVAKQKVSVGETNDTHASIEILPNPVENEFAIRINSIQISASLKVELFDILGNCVSTVFNGVADSEVKILNCSAKKLGLPAGKYLLKVTQDGKIQMQHILINN